MDQTTLHVVTPAQSSLTSALEQRLEGHARVRQRDTVPRPRELGTGDLVVLDFDAFPQVVDARELHALLEGGRFEVWLVRSDAAAVPAWFDSRRWASVRIVSPAGDELAASILEHLVGPPAAEIARLVLVRERGLGEVEGLVRAVCERPWDVRHPRQLAKVIDMRFLALKHKLKELGFGRVEHFITYVRWVAFEQLVAVHRLRVPLAQRLAGIKDPSNLRRQLERARRGSAQALKRLKGVA